MSSFQTWSATTGQVGGNLAADGGPELRPLGTGEG